MVEWNTKWNTFNLRNFLYKKLDLFILRNLKF